MIYVIIFIVCIYFSLSLYSKKYNSPYTWTAIFGKKGSGKSTLMIKMMLKDIKKGWTIYTDLQGVNIPGVRVFNLKDLEFCSPPPHSAVYLDEIGLTLDNRNYKNLSEGMRDWLALLRHYKCKVVCNSQSFDYEKKARDRTDLFLYQVKIAGCIGISRPVVLKVKPNDMSNTSSDAPIVAYYKWGSLFAWKITWIPRYAKWFNSFLAPDRKDVSWKEIPGDLQQLKRRPWKRFKAK